MTDLTIRRAGRRQLKLWLTDPYTGERLPLADAHIWFAAKRSHADADADAVLRKGTPGTGLTGITVAEEAGTPTEALPWLGGGVATVTIAATDTAGLPDHGVRLVWDAQYAPAGGAEPQDPDAWHGVLVVLPDVTRAPT